MGGGNDSCYILKLEATGLGDGSAIRIQGLREREEKDDSKVWGGHSLEGGTPLPMMGQPGEQPVGGGNQDFPRNEEEQEHFRL